METQTTPSTASAVIAQGVPAGTISATVVTRTSMHTYEVRDLQVAGARLVGGPPLPVRRVFEVILHVPCYPVIRVHARVDDRGSLDEAVCVTFIHTSDNTEDHIQAALLSELERGVN